MIARNDPGYGPTDLLFVLARLAADPRAIADQCRQALQNALGFAHVALTSSARAAIGCVLTAAAGGNAGSRVLVPAYTCRVVAHSVTLAGCRPVFADIGPEGYHMDPDDPALACRNLAAAVPALLYGGGAVPSRLAADSSVLLIEDACMAFGSRRLASRRRVNGAAVFSFNIGKTPCAVGGGAVATDDPGLFAKLRPLIRNATGASPRRALLSLARAFLLMAALSPTASRLVYRLKTGPLQAWAEDTSLDRIDPASYANEGMDAVQQLLLMRQIQAAPAMLSRRRELFALYSRALDGIPHIERPEAPAGSWLSHYPLAAARRDQLRAFLLQNGVETTAAYDYILPDLPAWRSAGRDRGFPRAAEAARRVVCLPFYSRLTESQVRRIGALVKAYYHGNR
jgi:dTDP-4-amino-4,6-dideoxygalactose transaminase